MVKADAVDVNVPPESEKTPVLLMVMEEEEEDPPVKVPEFWLKPFAAKVIALAF